MHLHKYRRHAVSSLIAHDERRIENHTNEKIDPSRSHLNQSLIDRGFDYYQQRLGQVFCINRKDINTIGSIVISLPKDVKPEDADIFFLTAHEHFSEKFGIDNVVSSIVHHDETTPHLHFKFIPVYKQTKTITRGKHKGTIINRDAVSFDEVCNRDVYRSLHKDFQQVIDKRLGYHVGVLNGATKGYKTVELMKEAQVLEQENQQLKEVKKKLVQENQQLKKENKALLSVNEQLVQEKQQLSLEVDKLKNERNRLAEALRELIEAIKPLERLKGVLEQFRAFRDDFLITVENIRQNWNLDEKQAKSINDFGRMCIEKDEDLEDAIDFAIGYCDEYGIDDF